MLCPAVQISSANTEVGPSLERPAVPQSSQQSHEPRWIAWVHEPVKDPGQNTRSIDHNAIWELSSQKDQIVITSNHAYTLFGCQSGE